MTRVRKTAWTRGALVGFVAVVALVGNMRASGSQRSASMPTLPPGAAGSGTSSQSIARHGAIVGHAVPLKGTVELIPAIYAWDPDVRYVFYRHVGKWM